MRRHILVRALIIIPSLIALDQITKYLADTNINPYQPVKLLPVLRFVNVKNVGAAFGMFSGIGNTFFVIVTFIVMALIVYLLIKEEEGSLAYSLILSGAAGNLIDRLVYGHVRDFIDVYISKYHWPAFNVADSALTIGLILLLIQGITGHRKEASGISKSK